MKKRSVQVKEKVLTVKFTPDQHTLIVRRVEQRGVRMSTWVRSILVQAAQSRITEAGNIVIREPDPVEVTV